MSSPPPLDFEFKLEDLVAMLLGNDILSNDKLVSTSTRSVLVRDSKDQSLMVVLLIANDEEEQQLKLV